MKSPTSVTDNPKRVTVIGAGYVGLPTAAVLAHFGHQVILAERDEKRLATLRAGESPIVEEGLGELLKAGVASRRLTFSPDAAQASANADVIFLCVPTPQGDDGSADLSYVLAAAREIAPSLKSGAIVVDKSTVPVGTAALVEEAMGRSDVSVVSNPEFLREGTAVSDSFNPDRIVIGSDDAAAASTVGDLFSETKAPVVITDTATAETIKYASNAFLATKLSFMNAIAGLCEAVGADVRDLTLGLGYDKRIGFEFMNPGPGWGGSCLPKDTAALISIAADHGYDFSLLRGAVETNEAQIERIVNKVDAAVGGLAGKKVSLWGLTFKAGTDDRRCSPAIDIAHRLQVRGAVLSAFDPTVMPGDTSEDLANISLFDDPYEAVNGAATVVLLTEWREFRWLDFARVFSEMGTPSIVDARNLLDPSAMRKIGFTYVGIGRP
ncbi:MAG: UDP-glucose/GDP-mannose dehydrogenase family protein [Actinomycetes bacterium]